jgi:hypothetical protein
MSAATAQALVTAFASRSGASMFPKLAVPRSNFARQLTDRVITPSKIKQGDSSLCGPASFLYCLARRNPDAYAQYVIDLYEKGEASIGTLTVKPGTDCRNYDPAGAISEVDWVALASLRDSENTFLDYDSVTDAAAGITLPSGIAGWFGKAGFPSVQNRTNLVFDKNLSTLLAGYGQHCSGAFVCLFVGADILLGKSGLTGKVPADHWVVLNSPMLIGGVPAITLLPKGDAVDDDENLMKARLEFDVYTWGSNGRAVDLTRNPLTVEEFLDYFYGFVSAK